MALAQRSRRVDERVLDKWMAFEMRGMQAALVKVPRPLAELLAEVAPTAATGGEPHRFEVDALKAFSARLSPLTRARLRVPITIYLDRETEAAAYVADRAAQDACLEAAVATGSVRDGKLWMAESAAREAARRYPTVFQLLML